jgi:hypothetical protein
MPAFSVDQENQQNYDEYYSGRYLITAVRHVITPNSLQTVMELSKNSVSARISKAAGNSHKVAKLF